MQVIATAGHVDHGKSTLVRALTGMEPDRWAEERRRGLTIDLGYAWLTLPSGERVAFVDVPGHERFVPNMLAGVGPVPAVLFAVAADAGWMPQSEEHLAAIDALGISRGLLVVTRADLADPGPALRAAGERMARSSLGALPSVAVSAVTGRGIPELLAALDRLVSSLPTAGAAAPVRLWVDRAFSIRGSGTVVTGTLPAGTVRAHDGLRLTPAMRPVTVRAIQSLKEPASEVRGVARVALNLRGVEAGSLARGMALVTAGAWTLTSVVDVRLGPPATRPALPVAQPGESHPPEEQVMGKAWPPGQLMLHIGAARAAARVRLLGGRIARLTLAEALPLHVGDRVLLRVPGAAPAVTADAARPSWPPLTGATVLDVAPPPLTGRGAAAAAARELSTWPDRPRAADLLRRHGLLRLGALRAMGVGQGPRPVTGEWVADPGHWATLRDRLTQIVTGHAAQHPLAPGMPLEAARAALGVPDRHLVEALAGDGLVAAEGLLRAAPAGHRGRPGQAGAPAPPALPEPLLAAVTALCNDLADAPFLAPEASRLRDLGLGPKAIAAAGRAGLLLRVSDQIVLAPGADARAAQILARLAQPFTTAQARQALNTTRRVAIPLLEYLDRAGITQRLPDDRRRLRPRAGP
jgi:selenocysteine-specific elongation factor